MADKIERNGMELNKLIDEYIQEREDYLTNQPDIMSITYRISSIRRKWNQIKELTNGNASEAIEKRRREKE